MHNEYVKVCCILNEKEKLLLLKYADVDITPSSELLYQITLQLLHQCFNHVETFCKDIEENNKVFSKLQFDKVKLGLLRQFYNRVKVLYNSIRKDNKIFLILQPKDIEEFRIQVMEQLLDLKFTEIEFINFFSKTGKKTKEDLLTYVFASQITDRYYSEYLFNVLIDYLKAELGNDFWVKHSLYNYEISNKILPDFHIFCGTDEECNTGKIKHDFQAPVNVISNYISRHVNNEDMLNYKLNTVKNLGLVLNNYYDVEYSEFNDPFKDKMLDLVDHIKVYNDFDKPKHLIKRM